MFTYTISRMIFSITKISHFLLSVEMPVEVSHKLDLEPELPDKYKEVALKQGEDPNKIPMHLDELRRLIYGKQLILLSLEITF